MIRLRSTENHKSYWANRKNWLEGYTSKEALQHPHRKIIVGVLKSFNWMSLIEIGCATGPNLVNIVTSMPGKQVGGIDVSKEAIEKAEQIFKGGYFCVGSADDIMMSDKSTDVVLSDACLIYVSPKDIKKYIHEIKRIARSYVIFCEFSHKSWWQRLKLRIKTGYNAHDYKKLLEAEGFYDIATYKLKKEDWPGGGPWEECGWVIRAKVPKN